MADLTKLRELLKKENISAYIIPTEDAHQVSVSRLIEVRFEKFQW